LLLPITDNVGHVYYNTVWSSLSCARLAPQVSSLKGKVALVSGASSGIGAGTSELLARLGVRLALNGRDLDHLARVAQRCVDLGGHKVQLKGW